MHLYSRWLHPWLVLFLQMCLKLAYFVDVYDILIQNVVRLLINISDSVKKDPLVTDKSRKRRLRVVVVVGGGGGGEVSARENAKIQRPS